MSVMHDVFACTASYAAASLLPLWYSLVQKCVATTIETIPSVQDYLISLLLASFYIPDQNTTFRI
jgi:hypothetical protein